MRRAGAGGLTCWWVAVALAAACDDGGGEGTPASIDADIPADGAPDPDAGIDGDAAPGDAADAEPPADAAPDGGAVVAVPQAPGCENLVPGHCLLPWPSDRWLVPDDSRPTGYRLEYDPRALPVAGGRGSFDVAPYRRLDGFSPSSQLLTLFDEPADLTDAATVDHIDRSLEPDSPTVVLDLETGERVAHWVENDARAESPAETVLYLRPAVRLRPDRPYGVAIRGLRGASGALLEPPAAFRALRDGQVTDSEDLEARRDGFEALFAKLEAAGVARGELQMAWRFHTESFASAHDDLLAMRADALERLGDEGLGCTVESVDEGFRDIAFRRVRATVTVPWYLDAPRQPAAIVRDEAGRPVYQGTEEVPFTVILPRSLADAQEAGPLITWGHGLFGEADGTVSHEQILRVAEEAGAVIAGTDWAGMSQKDLGFLAVALADISQFWHLGEMLRQGMINQIALTRSLLGVCRTLPELTADGAPLIEPERRYFVGGSQGSILGGTLLTLSPDISRGALIVGGSNFSFMIERSIHYNRFEPLLAPSYPARLDRAVLMALSQHIWDRAESASYLRHATAGLPGIGPKEFLYVVAENDAQVPNLASHLAARLAGIPVVEGSVHRPWGVPEVAAPYRGSAYVAFDVGDRPTPPGNRAPQVDDGGHNDAAFTPPAKEMIRHFLDTGEVIMPCDGLCDLAP